MQAHPDKRKVGLPGEDAFFCCSDGSLAVAGVADGTSAAGTPSLLCTQLAGQLDSRGSLLRAPQTAACTRGG